MASEFTYHRRVQFAETDMAGIVHFSVFFRYAEEAEHALLRSAGLGVHLTDEDGPIGFPRAAARCQYLSPARFEDELEVRIWVSRKGRRSIVYQYTIAAGGRPVAKGETAVICSRTLPGAPITAMPLPAAFDAALEPAALPPLEFRP